LKHAARTADSHEVHGLFRAATNGTDSRLFLWFACVAALAGLLANPAPRSSLSVTRLDPRFRASSPSFRPYCYVRPAPALVSFAPLQSSCSNAPVGDFRPSLLGFVPASLTPADIAAVAVLVNRTSPPLHRPRPRRPLPRRHCCRRFGCEVPTSQSCSDLTDSHGLAGFLRRLARLRGPLHHRWCRIRGLVASRCRSWGSLRFSSSFGWPRHPTLAIAGRCVAGHANVASSQRVSYPSKDSPHPQPFRVATTVASMVFAFSQPRSTRRFRYRLRRACRDCVMHHLRGVAPPMSPYRRSPFPAFYRPILSGLWPPSRSFDRGIAPVADASRTLCAGIPANEILVRSPPLLSFRSGSRPDVKELRSVPPPLLRRSRSNLSVGDPSAGHGGEGFVARSFDLLTAMKQVPR